MAARKKSKKDNQPDIGKELFEALEVFEKERGISADSMIEKITMAIKKVLKSDKNDTGENVIVRADKETSTFEVYLNKVVVEEVFDPNKEMLIEEAHLINPGAEMGDTVSVKLDPRSFGRIVAQSVKHELRQSIRAAEHGMISDRMNSQRQEIVNAVVENIDPETGTMYLKIDGATVPLPKNEQIEGEKYSEGDHIKVFLVDIKNNEDKNHLPRVTISRTHPGMVKRLFETEVPDIYSGTVEIKAVSREAGSRTKIAVVSHDENVDPVGACIGVRHSRVNSIVQELGGEKIDIVKYSDDPVEFIKNALSPATVVSVEILSESPKACCVRVPETQLSLAIGHSGQNARLAARLTGFKIDIRPESGYYGEE